MYIIIYVWTILEGLVTNIFSPICTKVSDRRGRTSITSHIHIGIIGNDWSITSLFNQLPLFLRNATVCSIHSFKKKNGFLPIYSA